MTFEELAARLAGVPRARLAVVPTPLEDAVRLRDALGGRARCPRILVKRDDLTGLGLGGNKARKLEFLMGDALALGASALITTGAVQSNHARMTAAAGRRAGLDVDLVLTASGDEPPLEGNLWLDHLFGARVHVVPDESTTSGAGLEDARVQQVAAEHVAQGRRPYVIPVGGSNAIGALGYVAGTLELAMQLAALAAEPTRVYFASGSRGTQAGLTLGAHVLGCTFSLYGVAVSHGEAEKAERARRVAGEAAALLGVDPSVRDARYFTDQAHIGDGYAVPTPDGLEALLLAARTEALVLDPTYTAKAFAAMVLHVRRGEIPASETVVFLHTGGMPTTLTTGAIRAVSGSPTLQN